MTTKTELLTPEAVAEFISSQRTILLANLGTQRKNLISLIEGREMELRFFSKMETARGLLDNGERVESELRILRRRLFMVQSKELQLEKYRTEATGKLGGDAVDDGIKEVGMMPARNFSRKIKNPIVAG